MTNINELGCQFRNPVGTEPFAGYGLNETTPASNSTISVQLREPTCYLWMRKTKVRDAYARPPLEENELGMNCRARETSNCVCVH
jgi:hypothetical protein